MIYKGSQTGNLYQTLELRQSLVRSEIFVAHGKIIEGETLKEKLRQTQLKIEQQKREQREREVREREKKKEIASRGDQKVHRKLNMVATAYIAFCDTGCIGITKTGKDVSSTVRHKGDRIIAVDPRVVPLHSIVKVEYGNESFIAYALDTGGDIKNSRIDILMKTKQRAREFGRREVTLTILREGKS